MRIALAVVLALAACGKRGPDLSTPCGRIEATLATCTTALPAAALDSLHERCPDYVAYEPEPGDSSNNLAALAKRSIEACAKATTCTALTSCLSEHRCQWILTSPGADPQFQCW